MAQHNPGSLTYLVIVLGATAFGLALTLLFGG